MHHDQCNMKSKPQAEKSNKQQTVGKVYPSVIIKCKSLPEKEDKIEGQIIGLRNLKRYEEAEKKELIRNEQMRGTTNAKMAREAERKPKLKEAWMPRRAKSDRRYLKNQDSDEDDYIDTLLCPRIPPKSAVRPLGARSAGNRSLPEPMFKKHMLPSKYPKWYEDEHPVKNNLPVPHSKTKDGFENTKNLPNLIDSFERHEQNLGIVDESGKVRSNLQLLNASDELDDEQEHRIRRIKERKNQRFISDLQLAKHSRTSSCPAAIGNREGLIDFCENMYDDVGGSETETEYTSDGEDHIRKFSSADE